jgi:superfamily II DNA or RNA helicase
MSLDKKREEIQTNALNSWVKADKKGTLEIITGLGKTIIALRAIMTMPKGSVVLWLAETNQRWKDVENDIQQFKQFYGIDVYEHVDRIEMFCYQSAYKFREKEYDIVIADEIHDGLTLEYSKFFIYNKYKALIGLSATINRATIYKDENNEEITKGEIIDAVAPVCFKYNVSKGQEEGTARKLIIHVINHGLDSVNRNLIAGTKAKPFLTTEKAGYDYWDNEFKKSLFLPSHIKEFKIRTTSSARARILYNLPSKIESCKKLLEVLKGKTIVFGNSIDALESVTPNVISSKKTDLQNSSIRESFDTDKINIIGSFKMLKQGANLKKLNNAIIMSYYSVEKDITQMVGRLRKDGDKLGHVFIYVTAGTVEIKWFSKMMSQFTSFEFIHHHNIESCVTYVKENIKE